MNLFKVLSIALLVSGFSQLNAQKKQNSKPVDNPTKCSNIKEGTFLRINYPKNLWYMTVKDNVQTEYYNEGKDFIKSSMVFIDDCNYKLIVTEKTEKENPVKVGDVYSNKVVATQDRYIKIQSKFEDNQFDMVLVKAK